MIGSITLHGQSLSLSNGHCPDLGCLISFTLLFIHLTMVIWGKNRGRASPFAVFEYTLHFVMINCTNKEESCNKPYS